MKTLYFNFFLLHLLSCNEGSSSYSSTSNEKIHTPRFESSPSARTGSSIHRFDDVDENLEYPDGRYCASVRYYNPNTGNISHYELDVEVENGELTTLYFPNGGWLDESHFSAPEIESDGSASFISDKGYQYDIELQDPGGCFSNSESSFEEEEEDEEQATIDENEDKEDDNESDYND